MFCNKMINTAIVIQNCNIEEWQYLSLLHAGKNINEKVIINVKTEIKKKRVFTLDFVNRTTNTIKPKRLKAFPKKEATTITTISGTHTGTGTRIPGELIEKHAIQLIVNFTQAPVTLAPQQQEKAKIIDCNDIGLNKIEESALFALLKKKDYLTISLRAHDNTPVQVKSKIHYHSYKKTLANAYSNASALLKMALPNNGVDSIANSESTYNCPDSASIKLSHHIELILKISTRSLRRILYGMFFEKRWNIGIVENQGLDQFCISIADAKTTRVDKCYSFYADPFFSSAGDRIRAEALDKRTGLGDIIELDLPSLQLKKVLLTGKHYSYPSSFIIEGQEYLLPEMASHSSPMVFSTSNHSDPIHRIHGLEKIKLVDGTYFIHKNVHYIFGGIKGTSPDSLYLFFSDSLEEIFMPHPLNPIVVDPRRARMAGKIISFQGKIYRLGQNNCGDYGNGIFVNEILDLSKENYQERLTNPIKLDRAKGPHTIDIFENNIVLDFYEDKFSIFAGYRRLSAALRSRLSQSE